MTSLLLATSNRGKATELQSLLAMYSHRSGLRLLTLRDVTPPPPEVEETGTTFAENARIKATAYAKASGLPSLADDSGLCVDALGGEPGIHSARWAGPTDTDRNEGLLRRLEGVPGEQRTARFVCAACLGLPNGEWVEAEGVCAGKILDTPLGQYGFGYDPIFFLPEHGLTFAQLSAEQKNRLSHRARAVAAISAELTRLLGTFHTLSE